MKNTFFLLGIIFILSLNAQTKCLSTPLKKRDGGKSLYLGCKITYDDGEPDFYFIDNDLTKTACQNFCKSLKKGRADQSQGYKERLTQVSKKYCFALDLYNQKISSVEKIKSIINLMNRLNIRYVNEHLNEKDNVSNIIDKLLKKECKFHKIIKVLKDISHKENALLTGCSASTIIFSLLMQGKYIYKWLEYFILMLHTDDINLNGSILHCHLGHYYLTSPKHIYSILNKKFGVCVHHGWHLVATNKEKNKFVSLSEDGMVELTLDEWKQKAAQSWDNIFGKGEKSRELSLEPNQINIEKLKEEIINQGGLKLLIDPNNWYLYRGRFSKHNDVLSLEKACQ